MIDRFALIVGAMKCGTTSVFNYLAQHAQIAPCSVKEPEFFSDEKLWRKGLDWYRELWKWQPGVHVWALEGSVEYTNLKSDVTVERIASVDAEFRFVYVVRNPIERIESHYNHGYSAGWLPREISIDEIIDKRRHFVERTKYAAHLDIYRDRFGADRILIINASDLKENPQKELTRVVDFLEIRPHEFQDLRKVHNPGSGRIIEHDLIVRLRKNRKLWTRMRDTVRDTVPQSIQRAGRKALGKTLSEPFRFSPATRRRVVELLADDLERLRTEYGVDTSKWNLGSD